jgi:hypothetical protein
MEVGKSSVEAVVMTVIKADFPAAVLWATASLEN